MTGLAAPFAFDALAYPWVLAALAPVLVLLAVEWAARPPGAITVSTGEVLAGIAQRRPALLRRVPPLLRAAGLGLLVVALAGPLEGFQRRPERANVVDIMLAVDVSGSMAQEDFVMGGRRRDRLYVTKSAVRGFIDSRRLNAEDRIGLDRVGLVLYAAVPWTQCPLTLDYGALEHELDRAQINTDPGKDGTAIGSAIGLAVQRLRLSEAKSKIAILLTDGLNNRGELDPITAAEVARQFGVRVYTIGAGATQGQAMPQGVFGLMQGQTTAIDEATMRRIAETTGGRYFRATDIDSLREAYAEIDRLERTEIDLGEFYEYREAFVPWVAAGAIALIGATLVRRRWCEALP